MSISYQKKRLIKEVVQSYNEEKKKYHSNRNLWPAFLSRSLASKGWRSGHPGVEKWVAIKGPIVAKWPGRDSWFYRERDPISEEMRLRRTLIKIGMKKHTYRVYLRLSDLIIEQNVGATVPALGYLEHERSREENRLGAEFERELKKRGFYLLDGGHNFLVHNGIVKPFDGRIDRIRE